MIFFKKREKSDVEKYYEQRSNTGNTAYNQPQNYKQSTNQSYAQPIPPANAQPMQNNAGEFRMTAEDIFSITGKGTVVTGRIEKGFLTVGDVINLQHNGTSRQVQVTGIEMFREKLDFAKQGDNVGILIAGVTRRDIARGDLLYR